MISSRTILSIILLIFTANYSLAAKCDERGRCKYGGRCDSRNECVCPLTCSTQTWKIDVNSLFCAPKKGGRPDIFLNICFVMAEACERQEDVPLIRYDYTKPYKCEAAFEGRWRLCSRPEDFTGPCGGTLEFGNQNTDAGGVCLIDEKSDTRRCECPPGKYGPQRQEKIIHLGVSKEEGPEETSVACDFIGVSIGASIGAGVLLGMLMFALIRKCWIRKSRKHITGIEQKRYSDGSPHQTETNRTENKLHGPTADERDDANRHCVIAISPGDELTSTIVKDLAAPQRPPQRQRLSGSSKGTSEDANNNFGSNQPRTVARGGVNGSKSAAETGGRFPEPSQFTQGLSRHACSQKETYTI